MLLSVYTFNDRMEGLTVAVSLSISPEAASALKKLKADLTSENNGTTVKLSDVVIKAVAAFRATHVRND